MRSSAKRSIALGPDDLLVVMSDHGFTSWRRAFHLNSWLRDNGYLALLDPNRRGRSGLLRQRRLVAHARVCARPERPVSERAGRERDGIVDRRQDARRWPTRSPRRLLATIDPATGAPAITKVYRREQVYRLAGFEDIAPDLIVGYAKGTRGSDESALGGLPREVIVDNTSAWSGDHCMDHEAVPGILLIEPAAARARHRPSRRWPARCSPSSASRTFRNARECTDMFGSRIKLDKALLARVKRFADLAGYSSVDEFVAHVLEKELAKFEGADSEEEIKKKLKGLGYIS